MTARDGGGARDIRVGDEIAGAEGIERAARAERRARSRRVWALAAGCFAIVLFGIIMPTGVFRPDRWVEMSLPQWLHEASIRFGFMVSIMTGGDSAAGAQDIFGRSQFQDTFMTSIVAAAGGAALGMCGSVYQGALRNPLAAPKTLGVMAGGALGSLLYYVFLQGPVDALLDMPTFVAESAGVVTTDEYVAYVNSLNPFQWFWYYYGKCVISMIGCLSIVAVVVAIATLVGRGKISNITLIISGQVFSVSITGLLLFCRYLYTQSGDFGMSDAIKEIENYALFMTYRYEDIFIIVLPLVAMMLVVFLMRNKLTALSLGDAEAQSVGVNVSRLRYGMVAICTLMVGWAISFTGHVAFLGFISAHVARKLVGPDMRFLIPASAFVGAIFITMFYMLTNVGLPFAPHGSTGMWCSIVGAGAFLVLALRDRGRGSGDWR